METTVFSFLFVNATKIHQFKAKDSENKKISKNFSADDMKKTELNGYVYDFSVDYDAIAVDDVLVIHKYLMKKDGIK